MNRVSSFQQLQGDASLRASSKVQEKMTSSSLFMHEDQFREVNSFDRSEISLGKLIGNGEFCNIQEVLKIPQRKDGKNKNKHELNDGMKKGIRICIGRRDKTKKNRKYVLKCLKRETILSPSHFEQAIIDLTIEAHILSRIFHRNIIRLCGYNDSTMYQQDFFIILEYLDCTLFDKIQEWKKIILRTNSKNAEKPKIILREKLAATVGFLSALSYLHEHRIIHRDLKPENLGFDYLGVIKLFDFGLAAEMKNNLRHSEDLYLLTGNTGSRRYMAPEIFLEQPYNEKVDIYSFGFILWEIMAMQTAFDGYSLEKHELWVFELQQRLEISPLWPPEVQEVIESAWKHDYRKRRSAKEFMEILKL